MIKQFSLNEKNFKEVQREYWAEVFNRYNREFRSISITKDRIIIRINEFSNWGIYRDIVKEDTSYGSSIIEYDPSIKDFLDVCDSIHLNLQEFVKIYWKTFVDKDDVITNVTKSKNTINVYIEKPDGDYTDYFDIALEYNGSMSDLSDGPVEIINKINHYILEYRDYSIKKYNGDKSKSTDKVSLSRFLQVLNIIVNVFSIYDEKDRKYVNNFINEIYNEVINKPEI